jgi:Family of unknown function (DUF6932)
MIPPFNDDGYLPAGIHPTTLEELEERFGQDSELRRVQMESVRWFVNLARRAGASRIVVNGSFVTDKPEPNDVDCVVLVGPDFSRDAEAEQELLTGVSFINVEFVEDEVFRQFTERTFASDRNLVCKGMVEVLP